MQIVITSDRFIGMTIIEELGCDSVIDAAYLWLCKRRREYPDHADIWSFRFAWPKEKSRIQRDLLSGSYRFEPLSQVTNNNGEVLHLWSARDALVLKALTLVLCKRLPVSKRCVHVKGHGGAKSAVRAVQKNLSQHRFVFKTDIKSYYASIDHHLLLEQLAVHIKDRLILNLLWQYMHRISEWGGLFTEHERGIPRGCALSPLMGAFFLDCLDRHMEQLGLFYVRFMDDILVLAPTRWKLKRAVKVVNQLLHGLKLEKHPEKTFIGRIEKGFDFLGYHFSPLGLSVAKATVEKFVTRATRLYEQERGESSDFPQLGMYVQRWVRWSVGGMADKQRPRRSGVNTQRNRYRLSVQPAPPCEA
ncbi:MAG: reverse transcriptase [Gammaproteobacteria bacterium]|nr:reverse transcriptase [Gammaproteobacteria bacterium]